MSAKSWILSSSICKDCGCEIVVTQGDDETDYCYYCSNPNCMNHIDKEYLGDTEKCSFAIGESE
jgi:hypothetical protein